MILIVCRLLLGIVFIISGFVKAVDPQGTEIKIQDYVHAFGFDSLLPEWMPLLGSLLLSAFEFVVGICLLANVFTRFSRTSSLLFMLVMTPVTLWLAIDNPVSDCGCFGDAIVLTNWQTFWKNVLLLVCALFLYMYIKGVERERTTWRKVLPLLSILFIGGVQYYGLRHLPILDFRPYKIGSDIRAGMKVPDDAERPVYATELLFERDGERRTFSLEQYPDSSWHYISTEVRLVKAGFQPPIHDFAIVSAGSHEDVTDQVLDAEHCFLVIAYDLKKADTSSASPINELFIKCQQENIPFYFITSSTEAAFELWRTATGALYPYYQMDATTQKTMIRSNPGVMELRRGVVTGKWNALDLFSQS